MKKYIASLVFVFGLFVSQAQMGSFALSLGLPQNEFKENTDATGFGADLSLAFPFQKGVPIYLGLDFNYMVYGRTAENLDLSANVTDQNGNVLAVLPIPLRIVNTNSIFGTHAFVRAIAPLELIQPYGEALFGFRYISTSTRIEENENNPNNRRWARNPEESNLISRQTVLDDWILSYGFGGGFLIKVGSNFYIDLRANFFKGQRAQYFDKEDTESWEVTLTDIGGLAPDDIDGDNLSLGSTPRESTTDMLVIKFGVAFKI